jgi:cytochrome P450
MAMRDYTFADGTTVPKGAIVVAPIMPIHFDERIYKDADKFNGFRFSDMRELEGESAKHHVSNTNPEFLHFGHGHHAWYQNSR